MRPSPHSSSWAVLRQQTVTSFYSVGVYHPDSQALSTIFFNNLSAVFDQLAMYQQ